MDGVPIPRMGDLVPQYLSRREASALTLLARDTVDVLVEDGVLSDHRDGGVWSRIPREQVERVRGAPITAEDYLAAKLAAREKRNQMRDLR